VRRQRRTATRRPPAALTRGVLVAVVVVIGVLVWPMRSPGPETSPPSTEQAVPDRTGPAAQVVDPADDAELAETLDAVVAASPEATCLTVSIDGSVAYRHDADRPLVPASLQKLRTALVALEQLGPDHRFTTEVLATAAPGDNDIVTGDLVLVGGGDPFLATVPYRLAGRIDSDLPATLLEDLADQVAASGLRGVTGGVIADETRYDQVRTVATWPDRYVTQAQAGPLSALGVDDGYVLERRGGVGELVPRRSDAPAVDAARLLTDLLRERGVLVGDPGPGAAPDTAVEITTIESPPLSEVVHHLLLTSDNQTAELLLKELGHVEGAGGTTADGLEVLRRHLDDRGLGSPGAASTDASGLDRGNRATCDELVGLLDASGGRTGLLGPSLPVAARSGTLADRFGGTAAEGRLMAKTGSLGDVASLAGFVELVDGGMATFAYVANADDDDPLVPEAPLLLGDVLAGYRPPCLTAAAPMVAPLAPYAARVGALGVLDPLLAATGAAVPLHVVERRYPLIVDRCLADDEGFAVTLVGEGAVGDPDGE
jgi:serine-type D-Ala-D-Ala carboxypeptidase/endopeptidase (penicillin-binding protein 4)